MSEADLVRLERALAEAMTAADPASALRAAADDPALAPELRESLASASEDGVRLTALIVARLRFERLINGSRSAAAWYRDDPAAFTAAFKRYHTTVAPTAESPTAEARSFDAFLAAEDG